MELKPCPFCGVHIGVDGNDWWAVHPGNGCILENTEYEKNELDAWNRRASGWIPVGEGLPERRKDLQNLSVDVLIYVPGAGFRVAHEVRGVWYSYPGFMECNPTHWQPLPEPPV